MRISDWSSDVCSSDLEVGHRHAHRHAGAAVAAVGAVDEVAGAAESPVQCLRVEARQARIARVEDKVARGALGEIAARRGPGVEHARALALAVRSAARAAALPGAPRRPNEIAKG